MSEIRSTSSDVERITDLDAKGQKRVAPRDSVLASSPIGVYDRPTGMRSSTGNRLLWLLLILVILILLFLAYQWWF